MGGTIGRQKNQQKASEKSNDDRDSFHPEKQRAGLGKAVIITVPPKSGDPSARLTKLQNLARSKLLKEETLSDRGATVQVNLASPN